jgi:hypothetical protein
MISSTIASVSESFEHDGLLFAMLLVDSTSQFIRHQSLPLLSNGDDNGDRDRLVLLLFLVWTRFSAAREANIRQNMHGSS